MRWTARVIVRGGRKLIQVRQDGYFVGEYASVEELQAYPRIPVDLADLEIVDG